MDYTFTTEIPENSTRRIHLNYSKTEFVDFGPIADKITANNAQMPTVYGFLDGYINHVEDNAEHQEFVDAFFVETGISLNTKDSTQVKIIGIFEREDGDNKVLVASIDSVINTFDDIDKNLQQILLDFHGFHKKIVKIISPEETKVFLETCIKK